MDIYLIRHGETDWNRMKKLQGTTDIPLNAYGIELAEKTAEGLKKREASTKEPREKALKEIDLKDNSIK